MQFNSPKSINKPQVCEVIRPPTALDDILMMWAHVGHV